MSAFELAKARYVGPSHWVAVSNAKRSDTADQYLLPPGLYVVRATKEVAWLAGADDVVAPDVPTVDEPAGPNLLHEKEVLGDLIVTGPQNGYIDAYTTAPADTGFLIFQRVT